MVGVFVCVCVFFFLGGGGGYTKPLSPQALIPELNSTPEALENPARGFGLNLILLLMI